MKIKRFIFPLVGLLVAGCGGNTSLPGSEPETSTNPTTSLPGTSVPGTSIPGTSEPSTGTGEINGAELDALVGNGFYASIPAIFSEDYEIMDYQSEEYPVDVYIILNDWTADEAWAYDDLLVAAFDFDESWGYIVGDELYMFIDVDDTQGFDFVYINIYTPAEGGEIGEPGDFDEIDPSELNAIFGSDIYSSIPKIYSNDYEIGDWSSEEYPIDIYIDLYDWNDADYYAYDDALFAMLDLDEEMGYIIEPGLYIYAAFDSELNIFYINIYSEAEEGGETGGGDPVGDREVGQFTTTIGAKDRINTEIPAGSIDFNLNFSGAEGVSVSFVYNNTSTKSIFNNASSEIRLYKDKDGGKNGGELLITGPAGVDFTHITIKTSANAGYAINGSSAITGAEVTTTLAEGTSSISIKNVGADQVRIISIVVSFNA